MEAPLTSPWAVMGGTVSLRDADRELRRAWRTLDEEWRRGGKEGMLRLREVNLVVVCTEATVEESRLTAAVVGRRHPARVIAIVVDPEDTGGSAAEVSPPAHPGSSTPSAAFGSSVASSSSASISTACLLDESSGHQVCSEEVLVRRAGREEEALRAAVIQILVPDVPVVGWWAQDPAAHPVGLRWLAGIADQVVTDLGRSSEPAIGLAALAGLVSETNVIVREFEWSRLAAWRILTAELFDQPDKQAIIPYMTSLEVDHHDAPVQALLFASWFVSRLGLVIESTGWWVEGDSLCARFVTPQQEERRHEESPARDKESSGPPRELVVRLCAMDEKGVDERGLTSVRIGSRSVGGAHEMTERAVDLERRPHSCLCSVAAGPESDQLTVRSLLHTEQEDDEGLSRVIDTPFADKILNETLLYVAGLVDRPGFHFDAL